MSSSTLKVGNSSWVCCPEAQNLWLRHVQGKWPKPGQLNILVSGPLGNKFWPIFWLTAFREQIAYTVTCREFLHHSVHAGAAKASQLGSTGITWSCACPPSHKKPMSHCFGWMPEQIHCSAHDMAGRGFLTNACVRIQLRSQGPLSWSWRPVCIESVFVFDACVITQHWVE